MTKYSHFGFNPKNGFGDIPIFLQEEIEAFACYL